MLTGRRLRIVGIVFAGLLLLASGAVLFVCHDQAQGFVHPSGGPPQETPADYGLAYETLNLTTNDGLDLAAWYVPSRNRAAIIVQHGGVGGTRAVELYAAEVLAGRGYGVIMVDLRAMGESEGDTLTWGLHEVRDLEAAYRHLLTRSDIDPERIGALGNSLGGVVVLLHAAQNPNIRAVAVQGVYTSLADAVATGVTTMTGLPPFPFAPLMLWFAEREGGFDASEIAPIAHIGSISPRPILLMQGGADTLIPPESGQRLYDAAGEPRELWFEPHVAHGTFGSERKQEFEARVAGFFDRYLLSAE